MTEPFVAGTFTSTPHRIHVYPSRGVFSIMDENNTGCWTDPHGRVLLPTLDIVDRVLKAHGYERVEMLVRRVAPAEGVPDLGAIRTEVGLLTPEEDASLEAALAPVMAAPVEPPDDGMTTEQAQDKLDTAIKADRAERRAPTKRGKGKR